MSQINTYFELIERVSADKSLFLCVNRVEKIPGRGCSYKVEQSEDPVRFYEYPWNTNNYRHIDEVSRLHRIVQSDGVGIRLETIN